MVSLVKRLGYAFRFGYVDDGLKVAIPRTVFCFTHQSVVRRTTEQPLIVVCGNRLSSRIHAIVLAIVG